MPSSTNTSRGSFAAMEFLNLSEAFVAIDIIEGLFNAVFIIEVILSLLRGAFFAVSWPVLWCSGSTFIDCCPLRR